MKKKKIEIGQTLESNDLYLPWEKGKKPKSKNRPVIVVDKNQHEDLVIIPGSTRDTANTTYYGKYGIEFYRHNIEIEDNEGKPIRKGEKFRETQNCSKLPFDEVKKIRERVINHTKFSSENKAKYNRFWNKKSRD